MPAMDLLVSGCRISDVTLQFSPKWRCNVLHFYLQLLVFLLCNKYAKAELLIASAFALAAATIFAPWIVSFGTAFLSGMCFSCLYSLGVGFPPYLTADLVQRFLSPFDDMEGIDAALTGRGELIDTVRDPSGAIPGNDPYTGQLFRRQLAVKLLQDLLSMSLGCPYNRVGIVVDNNGDVLVALPVTGFINTDVDKVIKVSGTFRLDFVQGPVNAPADGLPVDPHVFGDSTPRQVDGEPSNCQVEIFCKAAPRISPGNVCNKNPMLRT